MKFWWPSKIAAAIVECSCWPCAKDDDDARRRRHAPLLAPEITATGAHGAMKARALFVRLLRNCLSPTTKVRKSAPDAMDALQQILPGVLKDVTEAPAAAARAPAVAAAMEDDIYD